MVSNVGQHGQWHCGPLLQTLCALDLSTVPIGWRRLTESSQVSIVLQHGGSSGAQACASAPDPCSSGMHNNTEQARLSFHHFILGLAKHLSILATLSILAVHTFESRQEATAK